LNVPALWKHGYDGKDVVVGHLDTGVDGNHPALKGAIADFAEFDMTGNQVAGAKPRDSGEHGTHTAGTIVGRPVARGSFGVAPGAQLASALVIEGGQVIDRVLAGLEWIVERNNVRILSMSLGLRTYTDAFQALIDALRRNNILPVIAVGNEGADTSRSPGNYENVLSVGACAENDTVADFSGSQKFDRADRFVPDLVAPGVDVLSCIPNGKYARMDGTSMATPHVAGLAALLLHAAPSASAADIEKAILESCSLPASMPDYRANRGVPDAVKAAGLLGVDLTAAAGPPAAPRRGTRKPVGRKRRKIERKRKKAA
jgi:subtilisin family serine protease